MKICSLILTFDQPIYNQFDVIKRAYYDSIGHDYYVVYNSTQPSFVDKENKIINYYHGDWSYNQSGIPAMLDKFIDIIDKQIVNEYDFVIRENSSTFTNIPIIKQIIENTSECNYAGFFEPTWDFVSGACTVLSQKSLQLLLQQRAFLQKNIEDDVTIGRVLSQCGIHRTFIDRYDISNRHALPCDDEITTALNYPQIRIRNDSNRQLIDVGIWNKISDKLLLEKNNTPPNETLKYMTLQQRFNENKHKQSDINEHLETLHTYAKLCKHITEFGTRHGESTSALLAANPDKLISYDLYKDDKIIDYYNTHSNFTFNQNDTLKIQIEPTELLFIDTLHTHFQLLSELSAHSKNVSKFIILHDTTTYGTDDEPFYSAADIVIMSDAVQRSEKAGLNSAIADFLQTADGTNWEVKEIYTNNNGLTVLKRKDIDISNTGNIM